MGDRRANPWGISGHLLPLADSAGLFLSRRSLLQRPFTLGLVPPPDGCAFPSVQQEFLRCRRCPQGRWGCLLSLFPFLLLQLLQPALEQTTAAPRSCAIATLHGNSGEVSCPVISSTIFKFLGHVSKLQQLSWDLGHLLFTQLSWESAGIVS